MLETAEVRATGEFRAATPMAIDAATPEPPPFADARMCAWCGKPQDKVKKLLTSATVAICNECVALCAEILTAELGDDWM